MQHDTSFVAELQATRAKPNTSTDFLGTYQRINENFPSARNAVAALRTLGFEPTWAQVTSRAEAVMLLKPAQYFSECTGVNEEILLTVSSHHDFQERDYDRMTQAIRDKRPRVSADLAFATSRDIRFQDKLATWRNRDHLTVINVIASADSTTSPAALFEEILSSLTRRNLFSHTTPVTGDDFFGRDMLIQQLIRQLTEGRATGIFGLRKSGKTSLVKELGRRFSDTKWEKRAFVFLDLESLPFDPEKRRQALVRDLHQQTLSTFRSVGIRTHELAGMGSEITVQDLKRAIDKSLQDRRAEDAQVLIALDEIESLVGSYTTPTTDPFVPEFLGVLRSLVQENRNMNVVVSGLAAGIAIAETLAERENPFLGWAQAFYVGPFDESSARELLTTVGRKMALKFTPEAIRAVHSQTGGHVYLLRSLAADLADRLSNEIEQRTISLAAVNEAIGQWRISEAVKVRSFLGSFARYYPDENQALLLLADGTYTRVSDLNQLAGTQFGVLLQLGLIEETGGHYSLTSLARLGLSS